MGPTASQIRQELEQHREDAANRLAELENRADSVTYQARTQVEDTTEQIRTQLEQTVDSTYQLWENPLIVVGGGLQLGFLLGGGISGGGNGGGSPAHRSTSSVSSHLQASLMQSAKSSGLSDTISAAGSALLSEVTRSVKGVVGQSGPNQAR